MIIDFHAHLAYYKTFSEDFISEFFINSLGNNQLKKNYKFLKLFLNDPFCDRLVANMDEADIEKTVLLILDFGLKIDEKELDEIYILHHNILKKYPNRFLIFSGIDPRRGKRGYNLFKKSIFEYGFKGLKLYPPFGYSLNDKNLSPFFNLCSEYNLPIMVHSGNSLKSLMNDHSDVSNLVNVARKYPENTFIFAHAGYNVSNNIDYPGNVFMDISGIQTLYNTSTIAIKDSLRKHIGLYNEKILFGSDWPMFYFLKNLNESITNIKEFLKSLEFDASENLISNIFSKNAIKILQSIKI